MCVKVYLTTSISNFTSYEKMEVGIDIPLQKVRKQVKQD